MILDLPLERLRSRRSAKWRVYGADVLPLWVAEMDCDLAPPIREALTAMVDSSDTGYAYPLGIAEAYARFAGRRWALTVDPAWTLAVPDVIEGAAAVIEAATERGDGVIITPPVYHPFFQLIPGLGRRIVEVPLLRDDGAGWLLDVDGLEAAFASGARTLLLCSPHNPVGRAWTAPELTAVAEAADRHGALVVADEIHAPLVHAPAEFVPFASLDVGAARDSVSLVSASKAWNLAGLKAALAVASSPAGADVLARVPQDLPYHAGILGIAASTAAFAAGEAWLDQLLVELDDRRLHLGRLLVEHAAHVGYRPPEATFLAWLDCADSVARGTADLQTHLMEQARLAIDGGIRFGTGGETFVRVNIATSEAILTEAIQRLGAALPA